MTKVVLRAPDRRDEPALARLFSDPQTVQWNPVTNPADVAAWVADSTESSVSSRTWAVADPDDDRLLGTVSLFSIDITQARADIGYRTVAAERGRGVAGAAVRAATHEAFGPLGLIRVQLYHAIDNAASCAVARAAGFPVEGTLRSSYLYGDGVRYDEHLHARLRDDPPPSRG